MPSNDSVLTEKAAIFIVEEIKPLLGGDKYLIGCLNFLLFCLVLVFVCLKRCRFDSTKNLNILFEIIYSEQKQT